MKRLALMFCLAACAKDDASNAEEVITTVVLNFAPAGGGTPLSFEADDPDGNGGDPPVIDDVDLPAGDYALTLQFQNRLEDPPEEITEEVLDESDQHLLLFTGSAVVGPATSNTTGPLEHSYADTDANGLPIGLDNDIVATTGTGALTVTLRHMPPEEPPQKANDTVDLAKTQGIDALGGSTDVSVSFTVTVQ